MAVSRTALHSEVAEFDANKGAPLAGALEDAEFKGDAGYLFAHCNPPET